MCSFISHWCDGVRDPDTYLEKEPPPFLRPTSQLEHGNDLLLSFFLFPVGMGTKGVSLVYVFVTSFHHKKRKSLFFTFPIPFPHPPPKLKRSLIPPTPPNRPPALGHLRTRRVPPVGSSGANDQPGAAVILPAGHPAGAAFAQGLGLVRDRLAVLGRDAVRGRALAIALIFLVFFGLVEGFLGPSVFGVGFGLFGGGRGEAYGLRSSGGSGQMKAPWPGAFCTSSTVIFLLARGRYNL